MVTYTPSLSIAASKNAENAINSDEQLIPSAADETSPSEKRREAALKGWSRIREQKEKNGGKLKKTRITPSRAAAATASTTAASTVPTQPKVQKRANAARSATAIAKKGWETRRKKAAAAAASNPSPVPSSSTQGLSRSDAAKLGWARIREKKEAKKATTAAKKSSTTNTKGGLSRADAARLGWQRIREKQMVEEAAAKAPPKKKSLSHSEAAKLGWERIREKKAKENAKETEEATIWKARSKSSKKGWETRRKKAMLGGDGDEEVEEQDGDTDELFAIRSKSSLKGWATRRKKKETAAKAKSKDTAEWQMRSDASKKGWETRKRLKNQGSPDDSEASVSLSVQFVFFLLIYSFFLLTSYNHLNLPYHSLVGNGKGRCRI